jgi:hypothetical protein
LPTIIAGNVTLMLAEEATAFFHSDEFRANPVGVFVTPETLLEEWEAGKPWEEIRKRPPLPAGMTPLDMRKEREWR